MRGERVDKQKRRHNEKKFGTWDELSEGGRLYWFEVMGKSGWMARYLKKVDAGEKTLVFYQEIYNGKGELVEIHEKYPVDKGHKRIEQGGGTR